MALLTPHLSNRANTCSMIQKYRTRSKEGMVPKEDLVTKESGTERGRCQIVPGTKESAVPRESK